MNSLRLFVFCSAFPSFEILGATCSLVDPSATSFNLRLSFPFCCIFRYVLDCRECNEIQQTAHALTYNSFMS